jgi:hypothetical protein
MELVSYGLLPGLVENPERLRRFGKLMVKIPVTNFMKTVLLEKRTVAYLGK